MSLLLHFAFGEFLVTWNRVELCIVLTMLDYRMATGCFARSHKSLMSRNLGGELSRTNTWIEINRRET
jgi:hypothetical protein